MSGRVDFETAWAPTFWRRVERGKPDDCWLWTGTVDAHGRASWVEGGRANARRINASRFSYWLANGGIGVGHVICHRCDTPACVNPEHLFAGTQADNLADMTVKGRRARCGAKGEAHHNATITDADAAAIPARLRSGETAAAIAASFGVHRTTVFRAAKRGVL